MNKKTKSSKVAVFVLFTDISPVPAAAAADKSLQVSDSVRPQRRQPTRLPIFGILQARILEWVSISFSSA